MTTTRPDKFKDAIILLVMIALLIVLSTMAKAQDIKPAVTSYVALCGAQIVSSTRADGMAEAILSSFISDGEYGLDKVLHGSDSSWYSGADLYLASDEEAMMATIRDDKNATYKEKGIKKATVSVASDGEYVLVIIYSFR